MSSNDHLLELTSYFINRGLAIREPGQNRFSNWLVPIIARIPNAPKHPQLISPNFSMASYDAICASADRPKLGDPKSPTRSCLLHKPKEVHDLFNKPITQFVPGDLQRDSMALFQPNSLARTIDPKEFGVRRTANENALHAKQRAHDNAAHYLNILEQETSRVSPSGGVLRWGDIDQITRETALMVVWGRREPSVRNRLDELMKFANMAGLLGVLSGVIPKKDIPKVVALFPREMRRRAEIVLSGAFAQYLKAHQDFINQRIGDSGEYSLASLLNDELQSKGGKLPNSDAADQLTHWMFATRGTTAVHTAYALCFVAANQELQQTLVGNLLQEHGSVQDIQDSLASGKPSYSLQMIEKLSLEAGRLFSAVPFMMRKPVKPKKDDCPNYMVHNKGHSRRENVAGADPQTVRVDRWADRTARSQEPKVPGKRYGPTLFGGGPKRCPGMNLGLLLSTGLIAQMLFQYQFDEVRNTTPGEPLMDTNNVPDTFDQFGIELIVRPRRK